MSVFLRTAAFLTSLFMGMLGLPPGPPLHSSAAQTAPAVTLSPFHEATPSPVSEKRTKLREGDREHDNRNVSQVVGPQVYDDFNDNRRDSSVWNRYRGGSGPFPAERNQRLDLVIPANSVENGAGSFTAGYISRCELVGDYELQVSYDLTTWPANNGVRIALYGPRPVERVSFGSAEGGGEYYVTHFDDGIYRVPTSDTSGKLRMVRIGSTASGYYWANGGWVLIHSGPVSSSPTVFVPQAWSHDRFFADQRVEMAFDDLYVQGKSILRAALNDRPDPWDRPHRFDQSDGFPVRSC